MSVNDPMEWLDQLVRIGNGRVLFGDQELPGLIAQNGVTVRPNMDGLNILTVEFIVGRVAVDDPGADSR